jgi:HD superfamily phosphohydrolase YqeK
VSAPRLLDLPAWAVVSPDRALHIARVTTVMDAWARTLGLDAAEAARWHRAAVLHDALRDADAAQLAAHQEFPPAVRHGPAAAAMAERHGETDRGVLDAVRWHTLGFAGWDAVGRALYLADYLEPGRTHDAERQALAARMPHEMDTVLREVAARRIGWLLRAGRPIGRETWEFWNALARGASPAS